MVEKNQSLTSSFGMHENKKITDKTKNRGIEKFTENSYLGY